MIRLNGIVKRFFDMFYAIIFKLTKQGQNYNMRNSKFSDYFYV